MGNTRCIVPSENKELGAHSQWFLIRAHEEIIRGHSWKVDPATTIRIVCFPLIYVAGEVNPVLDNPIMPPQLVEVTRSYQGIKSPVEGCKGAIVGSRALNQTLDRHVTANLADKRVCIRKMVIVIAWTTGFIKRWGRLLELRGLGPLHFSSFF